MANKPNKVNRSWVAPKVAFERKVSYQDFYNARKWRNTSKAYRVAHPVCECEDCKREDIVKKADVCDHVRGLGFLLDNGIDPYDWKELQSMNHECHNKKSGSESHRKKRGMG